MKGINLGSAILAGVLGTLAMTALMYGAPFMGLPPMDLLKALGSIVPLGISPYVLGGVMHLAIGVALALLYALLFERILPGPRWVRGATFAVLPWLFAMTLMGPTMAWVQAAVNHAEARAVANPCGAGQPANPCGIQSAPRVANPCASHPKAADAEAARPWLLRMMSLMAHLVYGGVVATVYRRKGVA
jgi:hypothetical protein